VSDALALRLTSVSGDVVHPVTPSPSKDSKKYAATGGRGFAQFTDGKPDGEAVHKTCSACHSPAKDRDYVFTRYSR